MECCGDVAWLNRLLWRNSECCSVTLSVLIGVFINELSWTAGVIAGKGADSNAFRMCWEKVVAINHLHEERDEVFC